MGYVYLISAYHMNPCGYFKVGVTCCDSYKPRLQQIQSCSPFYIMPISIVTDSEPYELERKILDKFKSGRIRGEWFSMPECDGFNEKCRKFERVVSKFMKRHCDGEVVV